MKTIQNGHGVLSLFDISSKIQALDKKSPRWGLAISLISAFFIVSVLGLALGLTQKAISANSQASAAEVVSETEEAVAFVPGQFVSDIIKAGQGYIGK